MSFGGCMPVLLYSIVFLSALFSLTCFQNMLSLSSIALPLSLLYAAFILIASLKFIKQKNRNSLGILKKSLEYLPFILFASFVLSRTGPIDGIFVLDLASVLLWMAASILSILVLFKLSDKRIRFLYPDFPEASQTKKTIVIHGLEWIDALIQAASLVLLINLFLFQLYAIPSESMVPEFMIKDRVVVLKTPSGPKFPLSNVGIPRMRTYKRGDIIVFSNPHYNDTKEARVRSFVSQLVYMLSFTTININRDEFGAIKADPLVKRIVGVPGEKIMLVDGVLYAKTKDSQNFEPVAEDSRWAAWNIDALPRSEKALVQRIPLSQESFQLMESLEALRANADLEALAIEAENLVQRFADIRKTKDTVLSAPDIIAKNKRDPYTLFQSNDDLTRLLLTTNGGLAWFRSFMTSWTLDKQRDTLFEDRSMRLNILIKMDLGRLIVRNAELFAANSTIDTFRNDPLRLQYLSEAELCINYVTIHDQRNMGEFPAEKDSYIPENSFFMMGDNRFNSLDMRHSYTYKLVSLDAKDPYSIVYRSNLAPQAVSVDRILGLASFRFWPLSRIGIPE